MILSAYFSASVLQSDFQIIVKLLYFNFSEYTEVESLGRLIFNLYPIKFLA